MSGYCFGALDDIQIDSTHVWLVIRSCDEMRLDEFNETPPYWRYSKIVTSLGMCDMLGPDVTEIGELLGMR